MIVVVLLWFLLSCLLIGRVLRFGIACSEIKLKKRLRKHAYIIKDCISVSFKVFLHYARYLHYLNSLYLLERINTSCRGPLIGQLCVWECQSILYVTYPPSRHVSNAGKLPAAVILHTWGDLSASTLIEFAPCVRRFQRAQHSLLNIKVKREKKRGDFSHSELLRIICSERYKEAKVLFNNTPHRAFGQTLVGAWMLQNTLSSYMKRVYVKIFRVDLLICFNFRWFCRWKYKNNPSNL